MYDVVIIGAGVTGGLLARTLARYQLNICLLERGYDVANGASRANSGIVHAGFDAKEGTMKARLNVLGAAMMEKIASELGVQFRRNGALVAGRSEADRLMLLMLLARGKKNGVHNLELLREDALHQKEPNLHPEIKHALWAPTSAIICPYGLVYAAVGNAMDNGVQLMLDFEASGAAQIPGGWQITAADGRQVEAVHVVNCAGVFADDVSQLTGRSYFRVHPRRGEYLVLDKAARQPVDATIFTVPGPMGKGILVTPTVDGNLLLGPTAEDIEDKEDTSTTLEGLNFVREKARALVPDVALDTVITSFSGLRAVGNTGDFIIENPLPGWIDAGGIESPGLTAAPALAELIRDMLADDGLELREKADFQPYRKPMHWFQMLSLEERSKIIREDPAFGRIVCRCETVSEGEVLEAIRTAPYPRSVDGVKRRVRTGMGRCQGGFCMTRVMALLAREYGIPYEDVSKKGGDSYICTERGR